MLNYRYKGVDESGEKVEGELAAHSLEEAEHKVASQSITLISIVPANLRLKGSLASSARSAPSSARKLRDADIAAILRDLSVMTETGVPFVEALDAVMCTSSHPVAQQGLQQLRTEVVAGKNLSAGMRSAGGLFPPVVCELVRVAEEGGRLDRALSSAATYLERSAELRRKVMNAMLYPIVLSVIAIGALTVLVAFVLPKFATIFKSMKSDVPATTQFVLGTGEFVRANPLLIVGGLVAIAVGIKLALSSPGSRRVFMRIMFRAPLIGDLARKLALSRAFQSIATLLSCNVSIMSALEHGARVSGNPIIEDALMDVRSGVEHGGTLSDCLAASPVFTPMLVQMVNIGERTGRLSSLMASTANHLEGEVDSRIKALVSIVEPVMIAVMGCIVGFITISIITPIYSVVENIK
jgi:type IV pilus assembly protein PilC